MRAVKKINNNVAICIDSHNKDLVAFGKGIGFPSMPYEITDLSKLDRTFYNIKPQYISMLNDIPQEVIAFTARIVDIAQAQLYYNLNPNLVLTLADHIAFAMERRKKGIYIHMPLVYDIEQTYPEEIQIAKYTLQKVEEKFGVRLPFQEASGIALSLINAKITEKESGATGEESALQQKSDEQIIEHLTKIIEQEMHIHINRESFNYARYATHVQYLLQRIYEHKHVDSKNLSMYQSLREEFTAVSDCVDQMDRYLQEEIHVSLSEEEKLYLIMHANRICAKEEV